MNQFLIRGRLADDVVVKTTNKENKLAIFTVVFNDVYHDKKAHYFECKAFNKLAEVCEKWLGKGRHVLVTAKVYNNIYIDENGNKVYSKDQYIIQKIDILDYPQVEREEIEKEQPIQYSVEMEEVYGIN